MRTQEITGQLRESGVEATALLVQGATVDTILQKATELAVDVIVLGSHGRGAMHHLLMRSASEGVIRRSERPILVVPTRQRS